MSLVSDRMDVAIRLPSFRLLFDGMIKGRFSESFASLSL